MNSLKKKEEHLEHVEVAISTIGHRGMDALLLAQQLVNLFDVIIIHQIPNGNNQSINQQLAELNIKDKHIRYITSNESGVAKSRNIAIQMAKKKYLWFLDDDVTVDLTECKNFFSSDFFTLSDIITIAVNKQPGKSIKRFHNIEKKHNRISILSVGTIEIVIKAEKIRENNCWFPEDMGAGTELPIGDEPVFLSRCLNHGLSVNFKPVFLVSHPHESLGSNLFKASHCQARGLAFGRIFGVKSGTILLILFYLRYFKHGIEQHGIRTYFKGIRYSIQGIGFDLKQ